MSDPTIPSATAKAIISHTQYQTIITSGKHALIADEPEELNGADTGFTPSELLLASLGSCTAITLQMYINRKMWVVNEVTVDLELYTDSNGTLIKRYITVNGDITPEQQKRLEQIANACPVHKILTGEIVINTVLI
jgi:putative redox protein